MVLAPEQQQHQQPTNTTQITTPKKKKKNFSMKQAIARRGVEQMFCHQLGQKGGRGGRQQEGARNGSGGEKRKQRKMNGTTNAGFRNGNAAVVQRQQEMQMMPMLLLFVILMPTNATAKLLLRRHARQQQQQQQRSAFDLVRLEQQQLSFLTVSSGHLPADSRQSFNDDPEGATNSARSRGRVEDNDGTGTVDSADGLPAVDECRQHCDEQLRMGLDMVKAHSAFGSIGVPSVIDELDLQMFCRVDAEHDACLLGCGYQVQFNMRDFVCKRKRKELISHLNCYKTAAPQLRRHCGATHCGPYQNLEHNLLGVSQRCRTLLCDTQCIRTRLAQHSACRDGGRPALQFLITYSQIQVTAWLSDLLGDAGTRPGSRFWRAMPRSCLRLICGSQNGTVQPNNCTLPLA